MAAGSKHRLAALEKRMNLSAPPADLREATDEQLARIIGVDAERLAAMSDAELEEIIGKG